MATSLKRMVMALMAFTLVVGSFAFTAKSTLAQSRTTTNIPGKWASAIVIENVGNASLTSGQYSISFYNAEGTNVKTYTPSFQIDQLKIGNFYVPTDFSTLGSGQFSAVISSSQKVKAVVNSSTDSGTAGPWSAFSYEGVNAEATNTTLYFPGFYKKFYNFLSEMVVQNAGDQTATVEATFYDSSTGTKTGPISLDTIPAGAARTYSWNDSAFSSLPEGASYGVIVTSKAAGAVPAQQLAGISNIWNYNAAVVGVGSYNAFTSGSTTIYTPALYNQFYGFVSAISIQNLTGETATGSINYTDANNTVKTFEIPAYQSRSFFQPDDTRLPKDTAGFFGATITANKNVVAIVNIERKARGTTASADPSNPAFGVYNALLSLGTTVNVPSIYYDYYKFFTGLTVTNYGTQSAVVTVTYSTGQTWSKTIGANKSETFSHLPSQVGNPLDRTVAAQKFPNATITSDKSVPLGVVIQHNTDTALGSYNSAMVPNDFLYVLTGINVSN